MTVPSSAIGAVRELLTTGESVAGGLSSLAEPLQLGLWSFDQLTDRVIARTGLVQLAARLPNVEETIAAVFASQPELRSAWRLIVAARLREAGKRRDVSELCSSIELLEISSRQIRWELPNASLKPTGHQEIETGLFGASAEQAVVWPKLLRVIGATAELVEGRRGSPAQPLLKIDPLDPRQTWCSGRVLKLPSAQPSPSWRGSFVLHGGCEPLSDAERVADDPPSQAVMRWVLHRPWITLLAHVAFVQEAWEAEQISGRMALELAEDQLANPYLPSRVKVVVTTPNGNEILCGTLGEMVRRVLARLDVTLLARPEEAARLDERLAPVIHVLLEKKIWRFEPQAAGRQRPGYLVDDEFSTSCYRVFGSKYFYRGGSVLTVAIRQTCEQWAKERLTQAGGGRSVASGGRVAVGEIQ